MPFKSKAQRRFMYAAEARGDIPKGTAKKWEKHTPKGKALPEKLEKKAAVNPWLAAGGGLVAGGLGGAGLMHVHHERRNERERPNLAAASALAGVRAYKGQKPLVINYGGKPRMMLKFRDKEEGTKTAFERGFEKKAGMVGNFLAKNQKKVGLGLGAGIAAVGTGAAINSEMKKVNQGINKQASFLHAAELAGLGVLATPSAHELANEAQAKKVWTPKRKAAMEVGGLGILALPSIAHFASKSENISKALPFLKKMV